MKATVLDGPMPWAYLGNAAGGRRHIGLDRAKTRYIPHNFQRAYSSDSVQGQQALEDFAC